MIRALLALLLCGIFVMTMQGQYVTIEGRQFKDENGDDFYPVVCNYQADIIHDGLGSFYIAPAGFYGVIWGYDCSPIDTCNHNSFVHDFTEIHEMGFNAIRLMAPTPEKPGGMGQGFRYNVNQYHYPYDSLKITWSINPPYSTNSEMNAILKKLEEIVEIAGACGLKVILVPSTGRLAQSPEAVADVANYLKVYAARFAENPAVLAYDLYNEPTWVDIDTTYNPAFDHNKYEVCQYVGSWYDSVKLGDPNHLVTMGLGTFNYNDVIEWDPGILKLDFVSEHIYPNLRPEEDYNIDTAMMRFQDELIWTANNIPIPWIIGETGFIATDNDFPPFNVSPFNDYKYTQPPYVWGSTEAQHMFADTVIHMMRNCGASGISWWQFQDTYYGLIPNDSNASDYRESFFGLLNPGNWDSVNGYTTFRKPAVEDFRTFDPTEPPGDFPEPSGLYYNPFNYDINNNYTINGNIQNYVTALPIKDAVLLLVSKFYPEQYQPEVFKLIYHYTFTRDDGLFHAYPPPDGYYPSTIDDMRISYPGCERIERGWWSDYNPDTIPVENNRTFRIYRAGLAYDAEIANVTISANNTRDFYGWNSLTASGFLIEQGGECEMSARTEVNLKPSFDAYTYSEVHIFTAKTFPECIDFQTYLKEANVLVNQSNNIRTELEIKFGVGIENFAFNIYPNPSQGKITLKFENILEGKCTLKVYNNLGFAKPEIELKEQINEIDLSDYSPGLYVLQVVYNNSLVNKKIILR
ncbi:MAG: cellulase family glycosylhydrolase [Bacteroidetes bacterium]|nr:cellulase family glycosylhydrolase [Bacteroidota bacterium]